MLYLISNENIIFKVIKDRHNIYNKLQYSFHLGNNIMEQFSKLNEYAKHKFHPKEVKKENLSLTEKYMEAWNTRPLSMSLLSPIILPIFVVSVIMTAILNYFVSLKNKSFKK